MLTVSVDTFLRILTKGSPQKVQEFNKLLASGGYPYYTPLKDGAYAVTVGEEPITERVSRIEKSTSGPRRDYNVKAVKALGAWMKKHTPESYFQPPAKTISTPGKFMSVKLKPEFGAVINDTRYLIHVWYSKNTGLSKTAITLGNRLIQKNLCVDKFEDCKAAVLDLRKKDLLAAQGNDQVMDLLISSEFAWIDNYFTALEGSAAAVA